MRLARSFRGCELLLLWIGDEQRQRAIKNYRRVGISHPMPKQILGAAQFLIRILSHCELELVSPRGEWLGLRS